MDKNLHNTTNEQIKSLLQFKKYSVPSVDQKLYEDKYYGHMLQHMKTKLR